MISLTEKDLHYIWYNQLLKIPELKTTTGEAIAVAYPGVPNSNAGPDFLNAKVKIGNQLWYGPVEIHKSSDEWFKHKHHLDDAYQHVILHVVLRDTSLGPENVPALVIQDAIDPDWLNNYQNLRLQNNDIACSHLVNQVPTAVQVMALDSASLIRLKNRALEILNILKTENGNWNQVLFRQLCRGLGPSVNKESFDDLASRIGWQLLMRYNLQKDSIKSILLGTAGLLSDSSKGSGLSIYQSQFAYLSHKHRLKPMKKSAWKYSRLRPSSFPETRLLQLADLLTKHPNLFSMILEAPELPDIQSLLSGKMNVVKDNSLHTSRDTQPPPPPKPMGQEAIHGLIINVIAPILSAYGLQRGDHTMTNRAMTLLMDCKAENNRITRRWKELGWKPSNAMDSQAQIELYKNRCTQRLCLECGIGQYLLRAQKE